MVAAWFYVAQVKADLPDLFLQEWQVLKRCFLPDGGHGAGVFFKQEGTLREVVG